MTNYSINPAPSYPPPIVDYKRPLKSTSNKIGVGLVLTVLPMFLLSFVIVIAASTGFDVSGWVDPTTFAGQVLQTVSYVLMFVPAIFIVYKLLKLPLEVVFPMRKVSADIALSTVGVCVGASLLGAMASLFLGNTISTLTGYAPVNPLDYMPRGTWANALFFVNVSVLPAFIEEFFFRGIVMQPLRRFGDGFALIASSIIFGLAHGNLVQAPNAIVLGLVLGYFTLYSGSLWPAIAAHFFNNASSVVIQWQTQNTTTEQDALLGMVLLFGRLAIGVVALLYLKKKQGSLFFVPANKYPLKDSEKYSGIFLSIPIVLYFLYVAYLTISNLEPVSNSMLW